MFPEQTDPLLTLAEIAIAMAGFSAIVVLFRRRDSGTWLGTDADRFNGMIVHSVQAAALCLLPGLIGVFTRDATWVWQLSSAILGIQVLAHATVIVFAVSTTGPGSAILVVVGALIVVTLQVLNVLGAVPFPGFGPYLVGVLWHLIHAGSLFTALIWVREASIER